MKNPERVAELLAELCDLADNDFERHRIDVLARDLTAPPTVEVVDDTHQKFDGIVYSKRKDNHYAKLALPLHRAVWTYHYGDIADGCLIHHVDENPANNQIENLQMLTPNAHSAMHRNICRTKKGTFVCVVCGKTYEAVITGKNRYCSKKCSDKAKDAKKKRFVKKCIECGKEFVTRFNNQKFCSRQCCSKSKRIQKICPVCGKIFPASRNGRYQTCSTKCGAKLRWQKRRAQNQNLS